MTNIPDQELYSQLSKAKGKIVLITGGSSGIGKESALLFAKNGAKVFIGDLNEDGARSVVNEITKLGGQAGFKKCDVTSWDSQAELFAAAVDRFGDLDIVVPCAGVSELGEFSIITSKGGKPFKPTMKTLEINLFGALYSLRLALHYLKHKTTQGKAIIFIGSMSSIEGIPGGPLYTASKHGLLGVMSSVHKQFGESLRTGIVTPWFADTPLVPVSVKIALAGIPKTPVDRIAGAVCAAALHGGEESNGCTWTLPDGGNVFRIPPESLKEGVYKLINDRVRIGRGAALKLSYYVQTVADIVKILGPKALTLAIAVYGGRYLWTKMPVGNVA